MKRLFVVIITLSLFFGSWSCASDSDSSSAFRAVTDPGPGLGASLDDYLTFTPGIPDLQSGYSLEPVSGKSAFTYFKDEKILVGWNLGNTLDSYRDGRGSERAWSNPYVNQALLNGVKAAGFDIIRIPVTWMGHIGPAPDHRIARDRLERVGEVVDMAHNAGLKVIINMHHDGSTESNTKEEGWISIIKATYNDNEYLSITWRFLRVWTQIAEYFKNHGDWLMFESLNEIHDGGWGDGSMTSLQRQFVILDKWNQIFSDVVRNTGANNTTRYLVFPGYCTKPQHTAADYFVLPTDSASGRQVVTFHYYDPSDFAIFSRLSSWGSDANKKRVDDDFAPFKDKFIDKQIPVIIGEIGAARQLHNDKDRENTARVSRLAYLSWSFATAKKYGLVPLYWDNGSTTGSGEKFGLFDRINGKPSSDESKACIDAMIRAVK